MEDLLKNPCSRKCVAQNHQNSTYTGIWWKRIFCFLLVDFSWLFFRVGSFQKGWDILFYSISNLNIRSVFSGEFLNFMGNNNLVIIMLVSLFVLFIFDQINEEHGSISKFFFDLPEWNRWIIYLFLVISIILYGAYGDGYEQTQFIYFQF